MSRELHTSPGVFHSIKNLQTADLSTDDEGLYCNFGPDNAPMSRPQALCVCAGTHRIHCYFLSPLVSSATNPRNCSPLLLLFPVMLSLSKHLDESAANHKAISETHRERKILTLLAQGLSYKIIADKCNISYSTVNSHITHIYKKLHVKSGTEAVAKAIEKKII